jgi:hypothetical protein
MWTHWQVAYLPHNLRWVMGYWFIREYRRPDYRSLCLLKDYSIRESTLVLVVTVESTGFPEVASGVLPRTSVCQVLVVVTRHTVTVLVPKPVSSLPVVTLG